MFSARCELETPSFCARQHSGYSLPSAAGAGVCGAGAFVGMRENSGPTGLWGKCLGWRPCSGPCPLPPPPAPGSLPSFCPAQAPPRCALLGRDTWQGTGETAFPACGWLAEVKAVLHTSRPRGSFRVPLPHAFAALSCGTQAVARAPAISWGLRCRSGCRRPCCVRRIRRDRALLTAARQAPSPARERVTGSADVFTLACFSLVFRSCQCPLLSDAARLRPFPGAFRALSAADSPGLSGVELPHSSCGPTRASRALGKPALPAVARLPGHHLRS